jgi:hypothetical protein
MTLMSLHLAPGVVTLLAKQKPGEVNLLHDEPLKRKLNKSEPQPGIKIAALFTIAKLWK